MSLSHFGQDKPSILAYAVELLDLAAFSDFSLLLELDFFFD
jgi:hypothetical protein